MAQQQAIKLKIAGKSYSFTLKHEANEEQSLAEKEELYRLAERDLPAQGKYLPTSRRKLFNCPIHHFCQGINVKTIFIFPFFQLLVKPIL